MYYVPTLYNVYYVNTLLLYYYIITYDPWNKLLIITFK